MTFFNIINSRQIQNKFLQQNSIYLFISYSNLSTKELFDFRLFLKNKNLVLTKLNNKQFNTILNLSSSNDVVLDFLNKNYNFVSLNLSFLEFSNFFSFFFMLNYFQKLFKNKFDFLYIKFNTIFFNYEFFEFIFNLNKFLYLTNNNFLDKIFVNNLFQISCYLKINFLKFIFILKALLLIKMHFKFCSNLFLINFNNHV